MPRVWSRGDRVVYERDPMLFGVMEVADGEAVRGLVLCRVRNAPARDSFELFDAGVLVEAPVAEVPKVAEPVTQPGLPEGEKK